MFRLAVFNVLAHNRDDHSKNLTFLMDDTGEWRLSPAYDLTFSSGPGGEQSTMVTGNGKASGVEQLRAISRHAHIAVSTIDDIILQTREALNSWVKLAKNSGVGVATTRRVARLIC
jgi:serine/threonine-protein kinase HipA